MSNLIVALVALFITAKQPPSLTMAESMLKKFNTSHKDMMDSKSNTLQTYSHSHTPTDPTN